jgi:hypothetical protein
MTGGGNGFDLSRFVSKRPPAPATTPRRAQKQQTDPFVMVPLWWIERAAELTHSPTTLVLMVLRHEAWRTKSTTFPLPNARLKRLGVSQKVKLRVLHALERGGLISVIWERRKTPIIALLGE